MEDKFDIVSTLKIPILVHYSAICWCNMLHSGICLFSVLKLISFKWFQNPKYLDKQNIYATEKLMFTIQEILVKYLFKEFWPLLPAFSTSCILWSGDKFFHKLLKILASLSKWYLWRLHRTPFFSLNSLFTSNEQTKF